jgi:hypothetical protein
VNREITPEEIAEAAPTAASKLGELNKAIEEAAGNLPQANIAQEVQTQGIAVLGSNPASVEQAPFDDLTWKIYACSPHNVEKRTLKRVDQWFEIHKPIADKTRQYRYLRTVEDMPHVWMRDTDALPLFKGGRLYPEKEMKEIFCPFLFTSSIAFMLATAITDCMGGIDKAADPTSKPVIPKLGIWGVHQASETEYLYQRDGIQYFIWEATRRNITVVAPEESKLFEPKPEIF